MFLFIHEDKSREYTVKFTFCITVFSNKLLTLQQ